MHLLEDQHPFLLERGEFMDGLASNGSRILNLTMVYQFYAQINTLNIFGLSGSGQQLSHSRVAQTPHHNRAHPSSSRQLKNCAFQFAANRNSGLRNLAALR